MHLHEHQSKQLFADYGIPVPAGRVLTGPAAATVVRSMTEIGAGKEAAWSA